MVATRVALGIDVRLFVICTLDHNGTGGDVEGLFNRLCDPAAALLVIDNPIDNDLDAVFVFFIELWKLVQCIDYTVYTNTHKPCLGILLGNMSEFTLFLRNDRCEDDESLCFTDLENLVNDRL